MLNDPSRPIDYTNLGYSSLRDAMLALAQESLPEWTDFSENDLGVLLVELFAYACDITLYYQTRIASNLLPATSDEPDALLQLLRFIGYELQPPAPATTELRVGFDAASVASINTFILLPAGTSFTVTLPSGLQLPYETERDIQIRPGQLTPRNTNNRQYFSPVPVVQGKTVTNEAVGISDGKTPNQMYTLQQAPVITGSIKVTVTEPGGNTFWQEVDTLAKSSPGDRHFVTQRNATGAATLVFGDNVNGMIPPQGSSIQAVNILATYRTGGGPEGNVPALTRFNPSSLSSPHANSPAIISATNLQAAAGGTSSEDIDRARLLAPRLFRTQQRAVTLQDYTDLALRVPGVGKAMAVSLQWNQVVLYIAPYGQIAEPSELLQRNLQAFFENYRMATTMLKILPPESVDIYLGAIIRAQPFFLQSDVISSVEQAISNYLAFDAVDFGQAIYLSKVYDAIQTLPQVASLTVYKFSTNPQLPVDPSTYSDIAPSGIIALKPHQLPRPGYRDNPATPPHSGIPSPIDLYIQGGVV